MKNRNRLLSLLLVLCLVLACLPVTARAAEVIREGYCGENVRYKLTSDGTLTIYGTGPMKDYIVYETHPGWEDRLFTNYSLKVIKKIIVSHGVTSIGSFSFFNGGYGAVQLELPDTLTEIGDYAFFAVGGISPREFTIPDGVVSIGECAFLGGKFTEVTIPESVLTIGASAFNNLYMTAFHVDPDNPNYSSDSNGVLFNKDKTHLIQAPGQLSGSYAIPDSVTTIEEYAFYYCDGLTDVTIPDSVTAIEDYAFYYCDGLTDVTIPDSVTAIGNKAFFHCEGLTAVTILGGVTTIGEEAFYYCRNLASVTIPDSVITIGDKAFQSCGLTDLTIPEGVTTIGYGAFSGCKSLTGIMLPGSLTSLGGHIFESCDKLTRICFNGTESQWNSIQTGSLFDSGKKISIHFNEPGSRRCSTCGNSFSPCVDANTDYMCDICGKILGGMIRLAGSNRFETATLVADRLKETLGVEKFNAVILANGYNFADALAGSYLSTVKNAPILLTWNGAEKYNYLNDATIEYVKNNLNPGGTVYILGGTSAVPASIDSALSQFNIKRMDGANRFETNLMILEEAGIADGAEILVCTSTNFADSLSASAVGKPILLVFNESGKLYGKQPEFLSNLKNCTFTVIGGENAVSQKLTEAIGAYGAVTRVAGANRFDTSVLVAIKYFAGVDSAVLAYAWDFPDGLCGGSLAYAMDAPLILTMTGYESPATLYIDGWGIKAGVVLGGEKLISDEAVRSIFAMDAADEIIKK